MARFYYVYASMNSGKSTSLLQSSFNYKERGMSTFLFNCHLDDRIAKGVISSRIGLSEKAYMFNNDTNLFNVISEALTKKQIDCVMVDESQFLKKEQVVQLSDVVDVLKIPVIAYGLKNDYLGELFEGSAALLAFADKFTEIKGICQCGKKTTHVVRIDKNNKVITSGEQIAIGGEESYISVCRADFKKAMAGGFIPVNDKPNIIGI